LKAAGGRGTFMFYNFRALVDVGFLILKDVVQPKKRGIRRGTTWTLYTIANVFYAHL
jgi:hypothetical protein